LQEYGERLMHNFSGSVVKLNQNRNTKFCEKKNKMKKMVCSNCGSDDIVLKGIIYNSFGNKTEACKSYKCNKCKILFVKK
jgi:transposase-like protein